MTENKPSFVLLFISCTSKHSNLSLKSIYYFLPCLSKQFVKCQGNKREPESTGCSPCFPPDRLSIPCQPFQTADLLFLTAKLISLLSILPLTLSLRSALLLKIYPYYSVFFLHFHYFANTSRRFKATWE